MRLYLVCFLLVAATAAAYWNVDKCGFIHLDDPDYVSKNYHIFSGFTGSSLHWAFFSFYAANWHPVTWLSHMLDYRLYGLRPAGHHLTSLLFHILNTLLLFFALRSLTGTFWRCALVAALFALHPLHVESVAWVSERKDVLCAFFMFISLLCYSSYVHRQRHWGYYCATLFFFALGLLSKPMIVTFPFVLLLCDYWPLGRFELKPDANRVPGGKQRINRTITLLVEKIPFFFLSLASCIITALAQKAGGAISQMGELPLLFKLNNSIVSYMDYIAKTVWPTHLAFFYPLVQGMPPSQWKLVLSLALLFLISLVGAIRTGKQPFLAMGWLWFLGTLVPVIGLVQVGSQAMADRYTYIPLIGLFIMLAWLVHDLARRFRVLKILAVSGFAAALVLLTYQTRVQAGYWKNDRALSDHALAVTKYNFLAYCTKGTFLYEAGDYDNALHCYAQSLSLCSTQIAPRMNIGCVLLSQGKPREAIEVIKELLVNDSSDALAYLNCGKAFAVLDEKDSAMKFFSRAVAEDPFLAPALYNLGKLYEVMGDCQMGARYLLSASRADPLDPGAFLELGNCCVSLRRPREAVAWYEKAISLSPSFILAHRQLAAALDSCGEHGRALQQVLAADSIRAARTQPQEAH
jgi:protein O-mannosyl-transferase